MHANTYFGAVTDGPNAALPITAVILAGLIIITVIVQIMGIARSKVMAAKNEQYRQLAERTAKDQAKIAETLEKLAADSVEVRKHIAEVERILKDVE